MTHLITFTDANMTRAAEICRLSALRNNCTSATVYGPADIDKKFYAKNKAILDAPRGPGFWLWKPYIIDKSLRGMAEGDHLIYADAGIEFIHNVNFIIDRMDQDIWLFGNKFRHVEWCKGDVIDAIYPGGNFGNQVQASVIIIKNTLRARLFIEEWLKYCQAPCLIDDSPSKAPNDPNFKENRHDQAILTTIAYEDSIKLHWWPAQYNCGAFTYEKTGYNDQYPPLFHHHRRRNAEWDNTDELSRKFKQYFHNKFPGV